MTKAGSYPWHVTVRLEDVPETSLHLNIVADEAVRGAIAALANLRSLPRLEAAVDVVRHRDGLRASGHVRATVGQTCVITLEPLESEVDEPFDVVFAPDPTGTEGEDDPPEPLTDGVVADIGTVATEFLLLGLDPYPKKPGAVFTPPPADAAGAGPFAVLARLKGPGGGKS